MDGDKVNEVNHEVELMKLNEWVKDLKFVNASEVRAICKGVSGSIE